jgi:hypothetical protein
MAKGREPVAASDDQVRALLERYACPVPFHEVRTRFLGNIASLTSVSPLDVVKELWGGELPEFSDIDAANELIGAMVMGLWNRSVSVISLLIIRLGSSSREPWFRLCAPLRELWLTG